MRSVFAGLFLAAALVPVAAAEAQWMRDGRLDNAMARGDDNYSAHDVGFEYNFFGNVGNSAAVCTNGYVILGSIVPGGNECTWPSQGPTTADRLPVDWYGAVMAPYFTDVRTNFGSSSNLGGQIFMSSASINGFTAWSATWDAVRGYAFSGATATERVSFQLVLAQLSATSFVMEFNYGALDWDAEAGIAFGHDGSFTGTAESFVLNPSRTARQFSRTSCIFESGALGLCANNRDFIVPEPAAATLLAAGLLGLTMVARRRRLV